MTIRSLKDVSKERILKEFMGMLAGPYFVEKGFPLMVKTGILGLIPGLKEIFDDMKSCYQNPDWHAEGAILEVETSNDHTEKMTGDEYVDNGYFGKPFKVIKCGTVYEHTVHVMGEMEKQLFDSKGHPLFDDHTRSILMLAAILHDIGKPPSARKNGKKSPELAWGKTKDHDIVGAPLAYEFCKNLGMSNADCESIEWLVKHHMRFHQLSEMKSKCKIWRLTSHPLFQYGIMLAKADERGCRKTKDDEWYGIDRALEEPIVKEVLGKEMPPRILTGDFLIQKGFNPGPTFKKALDKAYEFQINDSISDKEELFKKIKGIVKGH